MRNFQDAEIKEFQLFLLDWFSSNGRDFPWRHTTDPYKILVSEILLQKTHVRVVVDIYQEFIQHYKDTKTLSRASISDVENIIRPLGFLNRAERLVGIAKKIEADFSGSVPDIYETLLEFKGVGSYIATAVMIFAFDDERVVVDTNVLRVFEKHFGIVSTKKRPRNDQDIWNFAQTLAPKRKIKQFNWALLDYGADLPKTPEPF
jgi:A/G-specific adenine glycosylase